MSRLIIEPGHTERQYWQDLWRYRELFYVLAWRDISVRYKQTVVGVLWAVLQPLILTVIFTVISQMAHFPSEGMPPALWIFAAMLPWQFFASSLGAAGQSLIAEASLISKVYFPRMIVPAGAVVTAMVDFMITLGVFLLMMAWYRVAPTWRFIAIPPLMILAFMAALGPGLLITALNVKYRDFRYIIPFMIQIGFYISPTFYSITMVRARYPHLIWLYLLNPMVGIIDGFRWALLDGKGGVSLEGISLSVAVTTVSGAHWCPVLPKNRTNFCGHSLDKLLQPFLDMSDIPIRVENLGKKYLLGQRGAGGHKKYVALRDVLTEAALSPFRRWRRRTGPALDEESPDDPVRPGANGREEFWALKDVSFEIKRGESVGIIGRNGAGKSTLLKLLSRITEPTTGRIELDGKVASLLEVGTGFHPELTGRENIYLNGAILGMKRVEIKGRFDEIVAFAEVEKFLDTPVKRYSSGMYVRLAFAVAAHLEPDVLVVDEVLAVGDAEFQKKCLGKMQSVSEKEGRTVLFVSHNMQAIRQMCRRVIFLKQGKIAYEGDPHSAISAYLGKGLDAESHATIDLTDYPRLYPIENAAFQRVRFTDGRGRPAACVRLSDHLEVEVEIRAKKPLRKFNLAMAVTHGEGLRVFSEAYSDQHALPDLAPGDYTLRFQVPMRFFKMESYFLTLAMNENGKNCDNVEGLLMPEIIDENPNLQMESQRWGVLRVPVTWDLIQPAREPMATGGISR